MIAHVVKLVITLVGTHTLLVTRTAAQTTAAPSNMEFCRDEKGCQHKAPNCILNNDKDKTLQRCICTPGFTGKMCETNIFPTYHGKSSAYDLAAVEFSDVSNSTTLSRAAIEDQIDQNYAGLTTSVVLMAEIQEHNTAALEQIKINPTDDLKALIMDYGNITFYVFNLTKTLHDDLGPLTTNKSRDAIVLSEDSLVRGYKQYLKNEKETNAESYNKEIISVAVMKEKGKDLPKVFVTHFGQFQLPFWETFQDEYKAKRVSIIVIAYSVSPYFFVDDPNAVNSGIVKILTLDDKMQDIKLPDPDDPVTVNAESKTMSTQNRWKDMESLSDGGYMAVITFNYSLVAATIDIKFSTLKECTTWGKYGNKKPSNDDHDVLVITKGKSRIVKERAKRLGPSFSNQILQLSITYIKDEAMTTPLVLISQCEDAFGARRRRRSTGNGLLVGQVPQFRVAEIDLRHFNYDTAQWEVSGNIKLKSGQGGDVAFESNFFGTFSASVLFIPPDTIDFHSIFLDFYGRLQENPYALSLVLGLWLIFILIAVPLRRLDRNDAQLWQYAPLTDNDPFARYTYFVAVSTAMMSSRKFTSSVYFNIKGDKNQTGPRMLSDGYRENFIRGTTSHFCLTSTKDLGKLKSMKIWHDNKGKSPRWLLSKVVVGDVQKNTRCVFSCGEWLSLDSADGKTYRKLVALDEKIVDNDLVFSDLSRRHLFDDHLWFSISKRPNFSRFTRVQRLWSIAALLFLSMITSAMFYNTPDTVGRSVSLGPFKFNYKQFYVGFMSAAIAIIPSMIIMTIFKNRKFKGENVQINGKKKSRCTCCSGGLPWWIIFLGYALIIGCISSSSFFIFMYSLDWGSSLTLDWMFAIFLGTIQTIFLLEPLKAVCLAVIVTCCCSKAAHHQMADIRFPHSDSTSEANETVENGIAHDQSPYIEWPDEHNETEAEKQYKTRLQLNQKLNMKLRSWILQLLYIGIVLIISNHGEITKAYQQNKHLTDMLTPTYKVNTTEHIYDWILQRYIPNVFSKWHVNGKLKLSYAQRFFEDMYHLRMGLSRIRQVRVQGSCKIPKIMQRTVDTCSPGYSQESEEKSDHCKDWQEYNLTCFDENEEPDYAFLYTPQHKTETLTYTGRYGRYGGGGYLIDIGPKYSLAYEYVESLRNNKWIDKSTRAVFVETMLFNANSRLFSHVKIVFELPQFGDVVHTTYDIVSSNLYPYTESWDYIILGLQILFIAILIVRLIFLFVEIVKTRCAFLVSVFGIVRILEVGFGISATVFYIIRIDQTISAIEKIFKDFGLFVSFEKVNIMDKLYNYCLGATCFITMIDLLKPLSFNFYLHLMKTAIISSRGKLFGFIIIIFCVVIGFASILFLLYGHIEVEFRDIPSSLLSLFRVMIGMVSFKQEMHIEEIGVIVLFALYCLTVTVIFMNMFISSLNFSFSDAREKVKISEKHKFDKELNDHFWWKISNLFGKKDKVDCLKEGLSCFDNLESRPPPRGGVQLSKLQLRMIDQYQDDQHMQVHVLRTVLFLSTTINNDKYLRCIRRKLEKKTHYMYMDGDHLFALMLGFHCDMDAAVIPVQRIDIEEAATSDIYPLLGHTTPCSSMFVINTQQVPKDTGNVDVKIVVRQPSQDVETAFLLSNSDGGIIWEQTWATVPSKTNPCVCVVLRNCPTHFLSVSCKTMFDLPPRVAENFDQYTLSPEGGTYQIKTDNRVSVTFESESVTCDTNLSLAIEPWFPSAMLHMLCLADIRNKPVHITLPQTAPVKPFKSGKKREFIVLKKEGILKPWRKVQTTLSRNSKGLFTFEIQDIKQGVQMAVLVKTSEVRDPDEYTMNKELKTLIKVVCANESAAKFWDRIGKRLGVLSSSVPELQTQAPLCYEEKCSIILEQWCLRRGTPTVGKLLECIKKLKLDIL